MRARFVVIAVAVAAWMSMGTGASAHGGGAHGGAEPEAERGYHPATVSFRLSGAQVPGGGDMQGRAQATLRLDPERETVCLRSAWEDLAGDVTGMHIHRGAEGENGPHHIELLNDENLRGERNRVEFCVHVPSAMHAQHEGHGGHESHDEASGPAPGSAADAIQAVVDEPGDFYLNVHTTAYPKGAVRGQLDG